jgi:MFS family permease
VNIIGAIIIGIAAGVIPFFAVAKMKPMFGYDDTLDAFGIHGIGGTIGAILTGVFADPAINEAGKGLLYGNPGQLWTQIIAVAVTLVYSGLMTFVIFMLIPMSVSSFGLYMIFGFLTGLLISWCGPINSSIFSDIFEPEIRASVFSVDRVFEGSVGALGTFFVGVITDITLLHSGMGHFQIAQALGSAMFLMAVIPWILCLIFYTLVYKTYPKDFATCRDSRPGSPGRQDC